VSLQKLFDATLRIRNLYNQPAKSATKTVFSWYFHFFLFGFKRDGLTISPPISLYTLADHPAYKPTKHFGQQLLVAIICAVKTNFI